MMGECDDKVGECVERIRGVWMAEWMTKVEGVMMDDL